MFGRGTRAQRPERPKGRARPTGLLRVLRGAAGHDPLRADDPPGADFERDWKGRVKQRTSLLLVFMAIWVVCIEARLVHLQVVLTDEYSTRAQNQHEAEIPLEAGRGDIVDRHGRLLAYSVEAEAITADPSQIQKPAEAVEALCAALKDCGSAERAQLLQRLSATNMFQWVRRSRQVTPAQIERVRQLELVGIFFPSDNRRFNPMLETAAHVVGGVSLDNEGQAGVEYSFNKQIRGVDGVATAERNRKGQRLGTRIDRAPVPGASLELTIDSGLQHVVERELKAGVEANRAKAGTVVVMDPHTGEVLAMASYPTFNPNAMNRHSADALRNRAVQDVYEPGSTFKIVTASAAIEEGVVRPDDLIDTNPGHIVIGSRKPINDEHHYGVMTFEDVIVKSSNVGAVKTGLRVGGERLAHYVHKFGFGQTLAPQLAGESPGIWSSSSMNDSRLASLSMGYEISVTPLQMAAAVSAIANGGRLLEPHVVRAVSRDGRRTEIVPKVLHQAVQASTAATLTTIMEGVVERGTAKAARLPGYTIAGKTGTSNKAIPGGYSTTDYNASFVGFLPSRSPRFTILVVIDTPRAGAYYGGAVSAPIFRRIAEAAVQLAGIGPSEETLSPLLERPVAVDPPSHRRVSTVEPTMVLAGGPGIMPDLTGLPAREAIRAMTRLGMTVRVTGDGFVARQSPVAGAPVPPSGRGLVELRRRLASATGGDVQ